MKKENKITPEALRKKTYKMKKERKSLSDKRKVMLVKTGKVWVYAYPERDVKEHTQNAQRRLKEFIKNKMGCVDDCGECELCKEKIEFKELLDKIFKEEYGEELT